MNILEKEIEDLVWYGLTHEPELIFERGLKSSKNAHYERQPELGAYGRPDIVGYTIGKKIMGCNRTVDVSVFELKKEEINMGTLLQGCRYASGVEEYIQSFIPDADVDVQIYLIGKAIETKSDFVYVMDSIPHASAYTFTLDMKYGLRFQRQSGYFIGRPGFPSRQYNYKKLRQLLNPVLAQEFEILEDLPF